MISERFPELNNILDVFVYAYLGLEVDLRNFSPDLSCAIALLEFLDVLAGLACILKLIEALLTVDILLNWG